MREPHSESKVGDPLRRGRRVAVAPAPLPRSPADLALPTTECYIYE